MTAPLTVGSLFSGIGGLDLGLERAGMTVAWQSEIDPYCCRVLAKHWPGVPNLGDVTSIDWKDTPRVDLICGGYPCQPFSYSGLRQGGDDDRHLWPYMLDALRHLRPRFALMENVPGHLSLGFGRVLGDLAEIGYDAEWDCIPAAALGAPHLRDRVWIVAHAREIGWGPHEQDVRTREPDSAWSGSVGAADGMARPAASSCEGRPEPVGRSGSVERTVGSGRGRGVGLGSNADEERLEASGLPEVGQRSGADAHGMGSGVFGRALQPRRDWVPEPEVGRVVDGDAWRVDGPDRLKGLGNAVVPQVAEYVGRRIMEVAA